MREENKMLRRKNRFHRWLAIALTLVLLAGQSHVSVVAQEDTAPLDTEISDEKKTDVESGEDISGADADGEEETGEADDSDAENTVEGDKEITGDENDPGAGTENGEEESSEEILDENVSGNVDEIEEVEEPEEVLTTEADGIETYANGDLISVNDSINDSIVKYCITNESEREVVLSIANYDKEKLVDLVIPGTVTDTSGIEWKITTISERSFCDCTNLKSIKILSGVTSIGEKAFANCKNLSDLSIASSVTNIGDDAFASCESLESVELPDSITAIGKKAFQNCHSLKSIKLSNSISSIEKMTFTSCWGLEEIELPDSVTSVGENAFQYCYKLKDINLENLTEIGAIAFADCFELNNVAFSDQLSSMGKSAFIGCRSLANDIVIPRSLDKISASTFARCGGLTKITIPDSVAIIEENAFNNCSKLQTLNIAVSDTATSIPVKDSTVFEGCPSPRQVVFWNVDGTVKLSGSNLNIVKTTYLGTSDGNSDDEEWWGWYVGKPSTYTVTIHVYIDDDLWVDHGITFALLPNGGGSFITDLTKVPNGTYRIYDITDVPEASRYSKAVDTGMDVRVNGVDTEVDVTVENDDTSAELHYYTATFYDGDTAYGAGTLQRPQVILNGQRVVEPEAPSKAGVRFDRWVTQDGGSTRFDFNTQIGDTTSIYASWTDDSGVTRYTIVATAGAGGTIDPIGRINVNEGNDQAFVVTSSKGYRIQSVKVDGVDMTESIKEAGNSYTFTDVRANHTIDATFETDGSNPGGNGDNDNSGDGNSGNNNSGGGNGDGSDSGDGNVSVGGTERVQNSVLTDNSKSAGNGSGNTAAGSKEPKTGDATRAEVYATIAMVTGLTYLLLYFMEEGRGMSEREKDAYVAAFIRWGRKGGIFRRGCAMVAIFCLLAYYHSIGKRTGRNVLSERYLGPVT